MISIFYFFCLIILGIFYSQAPSFMDTGFIGMVLLIDFVILLAFISINFKNFKKNIFRHSIFILLGFVIVHFQYIIEYFFNGYVISPTDIWVNKANVCKSLTISSMGLLAFVSGYQFYIFNQRQHTKTLSTLSTAVKIPKHLTGKYPIILVLLSWACFLLFLYYADPKYLAGYYGSVDPGPAANRFQLLLGLFTSAVIIVVSRNVINIADITVWRYIKAMGFLFNILIIIYILTVLFIGDRGPAITIMIIYFSGYVFKVKNRPKPIVIIVFLVLGSTLMTEVRQYRATDKNLPFEKRLELAMEGTNQNKSSYSQTNELAGSIRPLHVAVNNVPNNVDFMYGWFQLRQVLVIVPGMSELLDYTDPSYQNKGSTHLITYLDQGAFPTYGEGTTIIADFYIDLGLFGVIVGMFIFGYFISKFEMVAFSSFTNASLLTYVFVMMFMSKSIYFSRSTALFALQQSIWVFIIILLNDKYLRYFGKQMIKK